MLPLPLQDVVPLQREASSGGGSSLPALTQPAGESWASVLPAPQPHMFLDRDHSILAFNERVFDWAVRTDVPLLERLRYLCIVSSNLDEFFVVRAEAHFTAAIKGDT